MVNVRLIQLVLAHLYGNPETWDQHSWLTKNGSSCFGGWALRLAGVPIRRGSGMAALYVAVADMPEGVQVEVLPLGAPAEAGPVTHPVLAARAVLGLTVEQAEVIFYVGKEAALAAARRLVEQENHP